MAESKPPERPEWAHEYMRYAQRYHDVLLEEGKQ